MVASKFGSLACAVRSGATKEYGFHRKGAIDARADVHNAAVEVIVGAAASQPRAV
jgi:hypothetical protein